MRKGFTLIELLLVLAIIGVLTSLLLANLIGARSRARDAQRKSDLSQIQSALELYRADASVYPALPNCGQQLLSTDQSTVYMQKIPCDPLTKNNYIYAVTGGGSGYTLTACFENGNDAAIDTKNGKPNNSACTGTYSYTVTNP